MVKKKGMVVMLVYKGDMIMSAEYVPFINLICIWMAIPGLGELSPSLQGVVLCFTFAEM